MLLLLLLLLLLVVLLLLLLLGDSGVMGCILSLVLRVGMRRRITFARSCCPCRHCTTPRRERGVRCCCCGCCGCG